MSIDSPVTAQPMETRVLGRTGLVVSVIGMGCWQLGGDWGDVSDAEALETLNAAADAGVSFFDTADVYGDGRSERLLGRFLAERPADGLVVATKCGRRVPQVADNYTPEALREWTERSRENLGLETIPLTQLHCPPDAVYDADRVFDALDELVADKLIGAYGVSIETVSQGMKALKRPGVATVQLIFNAFRLKPLEKLLPACEKSGVGAIIRVPLASGLLSGKYDETTTFPAGDHRNYNREGQAFDVGETFSGVPYEVGLTAVRRLQSVAVPNGWTLPEVALRWCADAPGVATVIPGARSPLQARANASVGRRPALPNTSAADILTTYESLIAPHVHDRW
ncbi:MAG TPA: aldo/keto reductase [Acidimicrobiales bacterium]|nr:aldo/keto reductase [Acidimicrobiales bacterium]